MIRYLLITALIAVATPKVTYYGHKVITVHPGSLSQYEALHDLRDDTRYDFWNGIRWGQGVDIFVAAEHYTYLNHTLLHYGMGHDIKINDVQMLIDEQEIEHERRVTERAGLGFAFDVYHTVDEIYAFMEELVASSDLVTKEVIGKTYEGRDMVEITITEGAPGSKPVHWIDTNIHAREWITSASCMWFMNELVTKHGSDPDITKLLQHYEWKFLPMFNVDGFHYSHTTERMWRKNRQPNANSRCVGTDQNRNFGKNFGGGGASNDPCSELYHGPEAFSAVENAHYRDRILQLKDRLKILYSIHNYSQFWMHPWGWTEQLPEDYALMNGMAATAVAACEATHNQDYVYGDHYHVIYQASGNTMDWVYDATGVPYVYCMEMRDKGYYAFLLPEDQIIPNSEETWAGILAAVKSITP